MWAATLPPSNKGEVRACEVTHAIFFCVVVGWAN